MSVNDNDAEKDLCLRLFKMETKKPQKPDSTL